MDNNYNHYGRKFYDAQHKCSWESALTVVPQLLTMFNPKTVIDVGCGLGTWLQVFLNNGLSVKGIDGDWVPIDRLYIPTSDFSMANLEKLEYDGQQSDLAMSLEVAEHLSPEGGSRLVKFLTSAAPVVMFSAAIPNQGGANHVNEQWFEYWIEEFSKHDYTCRDAIRPLIWNSTSVAPWYQQNTFVFVNKRRIGDFPKIDMSRKLGDLGPEMRLVHPELFDRAAKLESFSGRQLIRELFRRVKNRLRLGKTLPRSHFNDER